MKLFQFSRIIGGIVLLGLLAPIMAQSQDAGNLTWRQRVSGRASQIGQQAKKRAESITDTIQSGRRATIRRLNEEFRLVKAGSKAALKMFKGQTLTEDEKKDLRSFSKRAGALLALMLLAGGTIWFKKVIAEREEARERERQGDEAMLRRAEERARRVIRARQAAEPIGGPAVAPPPPIAPAEAETDLPPQPAEETFDPLLSESTRAAALRTLPLDMSPEAAPAFIPAYPPAPPPAPAARQPLAPRQRTAAPQETVVEQAARLARERAERQTAAATTQAPRRRTTAPSIPEQIAAKAQEREARVAAAEQAARAARAEQEQTAATGVSAESDPDWTSKLTESYRAARSAEEAAPQRIAEELRVGQLEEEKARKQSETPEQKIERKQREEQKRIEAQRLAPKVTRGWSARGPSKKELTTEEKTKTALQLLKMMGESDPSRDVWSPDKPTLKERKQAFEEKKQAERKSEEEEEKQIK